MGFNSNVIEFISRLKAKFFREILKFVGAEDSNIVNLNFGEMKSEVRFSRNIEYSNILTVESIHDRAQLPEVHSYVERFLYTVEDVTLDSATGILFTNKGQVIGESTSWPKTNILLNSIPKPFYGGVTHIDGHGRSFVNLPSNGFYHWLIEDLAPFIFTVQNSTPNAVLVSNKTAPYVKSLMSLIDAEVLEVPRFVHLDQYTFTSKGPDTGWPHPIDLSLLRSFFAPYLNQMEQDKKIYISRLDSSRSPNYERELVSQLKDEGWHIRNTEDMNLSEQVATISRASTLCGAHGAGLAGMIWMDPKAQVIELSSNRYIPCFSRMAHISGIKYTRIPYQEPKSMSASEVLGEINRIKYEES